MEFLKLKPKFTTSLKTVKIKIKKDPRIFVYIMVILYVFLFTLLSFRSYFSFTSSNDLCVWDHRVWEMASGRPLYGVLEKIEANSISWAVHFSPITIFIAAVYFFVPTPLLLLFIQSLFLGIGAIPVYELARKKLASNAGGLIFSLSYLLYPALQNANLFEFHPVVISVPLLIWTFYFAEMGSYKKTVILSLFSLFCQENVTGPVMFMGIYFILRKKRNIGLTLFLSGLFWLIFVSFLIMPIVYRTTTLQYLSRLSELGNTPSEILATVLSNPVYAFTRSFFQDRMEILLQMFSPLSFLSFFSPVLLIALPEYALNMLTNLPCLMKMGYCLVLVIPFTFIAAVYGAKRILSFLPNKICSIKVSNIIFAVILFTSIYSSLLFSPLWGHGFSWLNFSLPNSGPDDHYLKLENTINSIPSNSTLLLPANMCPHASHFEDLYTFELYFNDIKQKNTTRKNVNFMIIDRTTFQRLKQDDIEILERKISEDFIKINQTDGIEIYRKRNDQ
jgi:uncharacterized membrane protein